MLISWFRERRRKRIREQPFPEDWRRVLEGELAFHRTLIAGEQERLHGDLRIFVTEKHWEGCGGLALDDRIKVTIAAQACRLILARRLDDFATVRSILVYPTEYLATEHRQLGSDFVQVEKVVRQGEAWYRGPVIVSWDDAQRADGGSEVGNVVLHEFAHQMDMLDGEADGIPPADSREQRQRFRSILLREYESHAARTQWGRRTVLGPYAATSPAEFFAVATERFFDRPGEFRRWHPGAYAVLREFYRQDPASRAAFTK